MTTRTPRTLRNFVLSLGLAAASTLGQVPGLTSHPGTGTGSATNAPIAWGDLGAKATAQYSGEGLAVATAADGAVRLRCAFQKLEGEVTREGLWLRSTVPGTAASRFRVVAERSAGIFAGVEIGPTTISPTKMSALRRPGAWPQCAVCEPWNLSSL
jgi:hypothetical protein